VVRWNGADRPTTYSSATQLTVAVAAADIAAAGTAQVTVFNPAPGGGTSNSLPFTIRAPAPPPPPPKPTGPSIAIHELDTSSCPSIFSSASVLDLSGNGIAGVDSTSLKCSEDDQPVNCAVDSSTGGVRPLAVALVVATTPLAAAADLDVLKTAARNFLATLGPNDRAALIQAGPQASVVSAFTPAATVIPVVDRLASPGTTTALYDAINQAITLTAQQRGHRHAVVILTGSDNTSGQATSSAAVLQSARAYGFPFYAVAFGSGAGNTLLENLLRQFAADGTYEAAPQMTDVPRAADRAGRTLMSQYVVVYTTPRSDGQTHTLRLSFSGPQGAATATRAYSRCSY
jgi:hypothetical protein